jgi:SOS response regulatory protein OraA/RecX
LPAEVVLRCGLDVGVELDRERARRVGRELRRHEALARATKVLRRRDVSAKELDARLARARVDPTTRAEVVTRLDEVGVVDDNRFASRRAQALAGRGAGDELIRHDLSARGVAVESIDAAVSLLEPEPARAARVVARRGSSPKTARYLAGKGFSEDAIESALEGAVADDARPVVF